MNELWGGQTHPNPGMTLHEVRVAPNADKPAIIFHRQHKVTGEVAPRRGSQPGDFRTERLASSMFGYTI